MSQELNAKPKSGTKVVYLGADRYKRLSMAAIEVSYHSGRQLTPSQLMQFLVDNYTDAAKTLIVKEMTQQSSAGD